MAGTQAEKIYDYITDEGEERSCKAISDDACKEVSGNFFKNVLNGASTKLAEQLVSPGTTLPWIFGALGVPGGLAGALVPVKDAGSLLPQLFVSAKIRAFDRRKWFWVMSAFVQAMSMVAMAFVVLNSGGITAGVLILLLLGIFSIASGVASLAFKDVVAKTIPKGKRGQMLAMRATTGGILTLIAGVWINTTVKSDGNIWVFFGLIITAAVLWALAAIIFANIKEEKGATEGGKTPVKELTDAWSFFRKDANLRNFIFTRALLMAIPLAQPFFIIIGRQEVGSEVSSLGIIVVAAGIANIISSPFWGRFSDKSSRIMMILVAALGIVNILIMASFPMWAGNLKNIYTFSLLLLIQVMAHGGARLSRKTYLVDFAPDKDRPLYVALSNTMIGLFTLIAAGFGVIATLFGLQIMLLFYAALLVAAIILGLTLKDV